MDRTERLFNLVLALTSTAQPIPRESLRSIIPGYAESASDSAFERMFERDKDDLRSLGIPIETVTTPHKEVLGYLIPRDDYRLPPMQFTAEQWALLGVAARAWSQAAIADPARTALRKLEAVAGPSQQAGGADVLSWQARPEEGEQWLPMLWGAIRRRCHVAFSYQGLRDSTPMPRTLAPWSVLGRAGGWYLIGFDVDRQATRAFRLSRITGNIAQHGADQAFEIPPHDPGEILQQDHSPHERIDALIAVAAGSGARLRMNARDVSEEHPHGRHPIPEGYDRVRLDARDEATLAAEVAALSDHAMVVSPESLADRVRELLLGVVRAHDDSTEST